MDSASSSQIYVVGDDDDDEANSIFDTSSQNNDQNDDILNLHFNIDYCHSLFPNIIFEYLNPTLIRFEIPSSILPKSILHVNDFDKSSILCQVSIETKSSWTEKPYSIEVINPIFGSNFIGKSLIQRRILSFFTETYRPSPFYLSQNYILIPPFKIDDENLAQIINLGYELDEAKNALLLMHNDFDQAVRFLETGINQNELKELDVNFSDSPLFYLILEITEVFFELSDHCCICGNPLEISGIRPMVCSNKVCHFSFTEIGVSSNIIGEIKRDPLANDLLISLASTTFDTKYFNPCPNADQSQLKNFFNKLPSMETLAKQCQTDKELKVALKQSYMFDILKFLILANKAHIITLKQPEIQIKECKDSTIQFLLTIATPEFEKEFQIKKKDYGNMYLWHGSNINRWYSILHNGLKDLGRTADRVHAGPIYGDGIYQSNLSSYSIPYSYAGENRYKRSKLPSNLKVLSMTENAKTKGLNHPIQYEYTQTDERACIIRALMVVKNDFSWDIVENPPKYIPTLNDVLKVISKDH